MMKLAWMLMAGAALAACTHGPYTPKSDPGKPEAMGAPIVFLDKDVRRTVSVDVPVKATRTAAGQLKLQVPLRNRTNNETVYLAIQTLFRDASGMVLYTGAGQDVPWTPMVLSPNQSGIYTVTSLNAEAEGYTIRVRYQKQPN
jgi:hypothetical protein